MVRKSYSMLLWFIDWFETFLKVNNVQTWKYEYKEPLWVANSFHHSGSFTVGYRLLAPIPAIGPVLVTKKDPVTQINKTHNVTFLLCTRVLLIGVAWGTASKCEELGITGSHDGFWDFLLLLSRGVASSWLTDTALYLK